MTLSREEAAALADIIEARGIGWDHMQVAALVRHLAIGAPLDSEPGAQSLVAEARQVAAANDKQRRAAHKLHLVADGHCMSDDDGHCTWDGCEQNNPATRKPHCQRDIDTRKRLDPDDEGRAGAVVVTSRCYGVRNRRA